MFKSVISHLFSDLDEKFPELTQEERNVLSNKDSPILREGVRKIPNGGAHGYGRIIITKVVQEGTTFQTVLLDLIEKIRFPCSITIDANGFMENHKGDIIFCFASPNTGLVLDTGKQTKVIHDQVSGKNLLDYLGKMTNAEFIQLWFKNHDLVSDYRGSGYKAGRIVNLVVLLDPLFTPVTKILQ